MLRFAKEFKVLNYDIVISHNGIKIFKRPYLDLVLVHNW